MTTDAAETGTTGGQHRGRFQPGVSGNPAGRPKGARHKTTLLAEKLMQDDAEAVVNTVLTAARSGDMTAARIVLDRLCPARKDNPVTFMMPKIESAADATKATAAILEAIATGDITPAEGEVVGRLIETHLKALECSEFEARLSALERSR